MVCLCPYQSGSPRRGSSRDCARGERKLEQDNFMPCFLAATLPSLTEDAVLEEDAHIRPVRGRVYVLFAPTKVRSVRWGLESRNASLPLSHHTHLRALSGIYPEGVEKTAAHTPVTEACTFQSAGLWMRYMSPETQKPINNREKPHLSRI
jgi:hypothetical protein